MLVSAPASVGDEPSSPDAPGPASLALCAGFDELHATHAKADATAERTRAREGSMSDSYIR
jgi:hypothetical protein